MMLNQNQGAQNTKVECPTNIPRQDFIGTVKGKPMPTKNKNLNSGYGQHSVGQKKITDENTKIDDPKELSQKKS